MSELKVTKSDGTLTVFGEKHVSVGAETPCEKARSRFDKGHTGKESTVFSINEANAGWACHEDGESGYGNIKYVCTKRIETDVAYCNNENGKKKCYKNYIEVKVWATHFKDDIYTPYHLEDFIPELKTNPC